MFLTAFFKLQCMMPRFSFIISHSANPLFFFTFTFDHVHVAVYMLYVALIICCVSHLSLPCLLACLLACLRACSLTYSREISLEEYKSRLCNDNKNSLSASVTMPFDRSYSIIRTRSFVSDLLCSMFRIFLFMILHIGSIAFYLLYSMCCIRSLVFDPSAIC